MKNVSQNGCLKPRAGAAMVLVLVAACVGLCGCGTSSKQKKQEFFTSGSREADQRATQRMAKSQQLQDTGKKDEGKGGAEQAERKVSLFERLGGEQRIQALVDDFTPRMLQDPRVNWERKGVGKAGLFKTGPATTWKPTAANLTRLKQHIVQFLSLATGGPSKYEGKEMKLAHAGMQITNAEFDAAVGDIKASLDKLKYPDQEQKELLSIIESTRPQIVTER